MKVTRNIPSRTVEMDLEPHEIAVSINMTDKGTPSRMGGKGAFHCRFHAQGVSASAVITPDGCFYVDQEPGDEPRLGDEIRVPGMLTHQQIGAFMEQVAEKALAKAQ
jgi:hypothetical protein